MSRGLEATAVHLQLWVSRDASLFTKPAPRKRDPQSHPQCREYPLILLPIFRRDESWKLVANSYTQLPLPSLTYPGIVLLIQEHCGLLSAAFVLCSSSFLPLQFLSVVFSIAYQLVFPLPSTDRQHIPSKEKRITMKCECQGACQSSV